MPCRHCQECSLWISLCKNYRQFLPPPPPKGCVVLREALHKTRIQTPRSGPFAYRSLLLLVRDSRRPCTSFAVAASCGQRILNRNITDWIMHSTIIILINHILQYIHWCSSCTICDWYRNVLYARCFSCTHIVYEFGSGELVIVVNKAAYHILSIKLDTTTAYSITYFLCSERQRQNKEYLLLDLESSII